MLIKKVAKCKEIKYFIFHGNHLMEMVERNVYVAWSGKKIKKEIY